jgi:hypothetical protein
MNPPIPYNDFKFIAETLLQQHWIYAKTMPQNPHHYALRKDFESDELFDELVEMMRRYSYAGKFGGREYRYVDVNEHYYWTMGAPVRQTILINRKLREPSPYDQIAPQYSGLFTDAESLRENSDVLDMIGYTGGSMLELGCASCPLIEELPVSHYCGIDPSKGMIDLCRKQFPCGNFVQSDFEAFYSGEKYNNIVATFGAASYIHPQLLPKIFDMLVPGGRYFLMFYKDTYMPKTYQKTGIFLDWFKGNYASLPGDATEYHDYVIKEGRL